MSINQNLVKPNLYELQGYDTSITYATTSVDGTPRLSFTYRGTFLNFSGKDILSETSHIGQMIIVSLRELSIPEVSESLALLIPQVCLKAESSEVTIQTIAILNQTSEASRYCMQSFTSLCLTGTARRIFA